jgi:ribonuclease HII
MQLALRPVVRSESGLWAYERVLQRCGFPLVAGADEAGRGACAGPLVVAAVILPPGRRGEVPGLADSKLLTEKAREAAYAEVVRRALSWSVVVVPPQEVDRCGLHVMNVRAMRQAVGRLDPCPSYALTDGFPVTGMPVPTLAVWKGDRVSACVAAASVVAKVTRDRIMTVLDRDFPQYGFAVHKGYVVPEHRAALRAHGPCPEHRFSYVNVRGALIRPAADQPDMVDTDSMDDLGEIMSAAI